MLRREREEGYGTCVETGGECTVPCYVVRRVRELETLFGGAVRFSGSYHQRGSVVIAYTCSGQHRIGFHLPRHPAAPPTTTGGHAWSSARPRACRRRAGTLPPSVTNYDQRGRRALSVSVICKASMMCVISQASIRQCTGN